MRRTGTSRCWLKLPKDRVYIMTENTLARMMGRYNGEYVCSVCGGAFKVGDSITVKYSRRARQFHTVCLDALYV